MHKSLEIRELIKQEIIDGKLTGGSRLMPVRQLAQFYGISYLTMNHVLEQLEQENLIVRVHGKGVFVSSATQRSPREIRRVLTLYHGRDAIVPLFLKKGVGFGERGKTSFPVKRSFSPLPKSAFTLIELPMVMSQPKIISSPITKMKQ